MVMTRTGDLGSSTQRKTFVVVVKYVILGRLPYQIPDRKVSMMVSPAGCGLAFTTTPSKIDDQLSTVTLISPGKKPASSTVFLSELLNLVCFLFFY